MRRALAVGGLGWAAALLAVGSLAPTAHGQAMPVIYSVSDLQGSMAGGTRCEGSPHLGRRGRPQVASQLAQAPSRDTRAISCSQRV